MHLKLTLFCATVQYIVKYRLSFHFSKLETFWWELSQIDDDLMPLGRLFSFTKHSEMSLNMLVVSVLVCLLEIFTLAEHSAEKNK